MATPPTFSAGAVLTAAEMNQIGLWKIKPASAVNGTVGSTGRVTFTSQTSVSLNNCFVSDFDQFLVIFYTSAVTANANITWKLRVGGVNTTGNDYYWGTQTVGSNGATAASNGGGVASVNPSYTNSGYGVGSSRINLFGPNLARVTIYDFVDNFNDTVAQQIRRGGGSHSLTTAYDGITFAIASGNFTGTVDVYGYRN